MPISIEIDRDVCIGAGQCALAAPKIFTQDEDGFSEVLPPSGGEDRGPTAGEAARVCPVQAITVA
ncbi:ferredoxin [Streptomyces sp. NPDC088729]|uniref:ferredoxin n=1 Tax=Streptomyces sp. NPDC088729 TaxID=3365876 RepID=UPI0038133561